MNRITSKIVVGTHVMFYEIEMIEGYVASLLDAVNQVHRHDRENITFDFCLNGLSTFETLDKGAYGGTMTELKEQFENAVYPLMLSGANVYLSDKLPLGWGSYEPYTMTDYRRWLNEHYCTRTDTVVWGESDCLAPRELFLALDAAKSACNAANIHRYVLTFATRKMWDTSWEALEHPRFANATYFERDDPETYLHPSSIHYTMSKDEMDEINAEARGEFDFRLLKGAFKFDGSFLCISSDLIKFGANIPPGIFGLSAEDTAFMYSCMRLMGKDSIQIVVKNILKVHNREHPKKRMYVKSTATGETSTQKTKGDWYDTLREMNKRNLEIYANDTQAAFLTWDDYFAKIGK